MNVNFPESAVQKATDDYVRDLYEKKGKNSKTDVSEQKPQSTSSISFSLISVAYADEGFKVDSPKAKEIKARLRKYVDDVIAQKRNGSIGETNDGFLVIKNKTLSPLLKKKVEAIVKNDNSARLELYHEIVDANGLAAARIDSIEQSFARSFQSMSPSGTWIQNSEGVWSQKP